MENLFFAKGGSTPASEKELEDAPPLSFSANGEPLIAWNVKANMSRSGTPVLDSPIYASECGDLIESGAHSGEYVIPIICGGTTKNIYLSEPIRKIDNYADIKSESQEYRAIYKLVLTGEEGFTLSSNYEHTFFRTYSNIQCPVPMSNTNSICSHLARETQTADLTSGEYIMSGSTLYIRHDDYSSGSAFNQWLAQQYANGTPITFWYVLAEPITQSIAAPAIPTVKGSNTLSVGTTVQPSSVYIKYKEGGDEMVTLAKIGGRYNTPLLEIRGLSTDTKPTTKIEGMVVVNGSTYIEIDTGDTYMFDAENGVWHNITG